MAREYTTVDFNVSVAGAEALGGRESTIDVTNDAGRSLRWGRFLISVAGSVLAESVVLTAREIHFPRDPDDSFEFSTTEVRKAKSGDPSPLVVTRQQWQGETVDSPPPEGPAPELDFDDAQRAFHTIGELLWAAGVRDQTAQSE